MQKRSLHPETRIGPVALAISDLERSVIFYEQVLGFEIIDRQAQTARLGAGGTPLLLLQQQQRARPRPPRTTGLYHFAILTPSRADLGRALRQLLELGYPLQGAADHLVSEAIYLSDPDGNGIEIYRDRPREQWRRQNDQVQMANAPLDVDGILAAAGQTEHRAAGLAPGTRIGHVHLQVGDLEQAEAFYCKVLGFEMMARWPGAIFIAAGGYHHHLGLNIWETHGAPAPPADAVGLRYYTILLPNEEELASARARLQAAGVAAHSAPGRLSLRDPWQNGMMLTIAGGEAGLTSAEAIGQ
ncbi:MAG: catechol-2,3-dioxygenase [Herpetosiphonaceae bacterium]|nr:MAG: catechol-2,3-dioxygenase [Herpetosiphonaceae bacterium]